MQNNTLRVCARACVCVYVCCVCIEKHLFLNIAPISTTDRFYTGPTVFKFGEGLSYTQFDVQVRY